MIITKKKDFKVESTSCHLQFNILFFMNDDDDNNNNFFSSPSLCSNIINDCASTFQMQLQQYTSPFSSIIHYFFNIKRKHKNIFFVLFLYFFFNSLRIWEMRFNARDILTTLFVDNCIVDSLLVLFIFNLILCL